LKAYFVCNDEVMTSTSENNLIDPATSMKYTRVKLEVTRSDAMDVLGKFTCKCHAASSKGEVASGEAVVKIACKYFNFELERKQSYIVAK
jgi:hypothetical protein